MTEIRTALVRKFGPLPAWAWAAILGGALYLYRRNAALRAGTAPAPNTDATSPSVSTDTTPRDPVTLQPGESAYDPNTGQLVSTSPEQQPSGDPLDPTGWGMGDRLPVTLQPGEAVYDPVTGAFLTGHPDSTQDGAGAPAGKPPGKKASTKRPRIVQKPSASHGGKMADYHDYGNGKLVFVRLIKKAATKRTKKSKPQHRRTETVKRSTKRPRPHGVGKLKTSLHTKRSQPTQPKSRSRAHAASMQPTRARTPATPEAQPAMRQRPAAPRVVDNASQRTARHPAKPAAAHHEPPKKQRRGRR